ncbi:MAG: hypothetical protein KC414_14330 [Romboutsia sp.]|nr:hypothetical protein [Romboutsia sp.]
MTDFINENNTRVRLNNDDRPDSTLYSVIRKHFLDSNWYLNRNKKRTQLIFSKSSNPIS